MRSRSRCRRFRVAIIDSGIDATHPELADKIVEAKSFVGGSASVDHEGHGTFVAGLIAAAVDNSSGSREWPRRPSC